MDKRCTIGIFFIRKKHWCDQLDGLGFLLSFWLATTEIDFSSLPHELTVEIALLSDYSMGFQLLLGAQTIRLFSSINLTIGVSRLWPTVRVITTSTIQIRSCGTVN
jgi:hypothetical protein